MKDKIFTGENKEERLKKSLEESPLFNLSLSSKELFHSNFLYWIGTRYRNLFVAICKDLECNAHWESQDWKIKREYNNYDLCIECSKGDIPFILENKVKSIPYKKQLDKYAEELKPSENSPVDLVLLSLVTDFPDKEKIVKDGLWKVKNYHDLYKAIVRNKNKFVSDPYDLFLMEDYCLFIKCLHELAETWNIKEEDKFLPKSEMKEICKELRINDLYEKVWYNQAFNKLQNKLDKIPHIKIESGKDIEEIKKSEDPPLKNIFINWGFTHAQGLLEAKVKVSNEYVLLIQIQGNRYCRGIEWIKSAWQSHAEYWEDTRKEKLISNLSFFQFEENGNDTFPEVCDKKEKIHARNTKEGSRIYNKYGDRFLYQSKKIKDEASISEVIEAIKEDISRIIETS